MDEVVENKKTMGFRGILLLAVRLDEVEKTHLSLFIFAGADRRFFGVGEQYPDDEEIERCLAM
ncbi:MAG: hypothetical protein JXA30_17160 [Deltaproteobacteria bacterium]|nr:hypothetical protein [Deltaproteobacteria bacterium]